MVLQSPEEERLAETPSLPIAPAPNPAGSVQCQRELGATRNAYETDGAREP